MNDTDIRTHNREAWNRQVEKGNRWTVPVDHETVEAAREGRWEILLTPTKPVPRAWFGTLEGRHVLCLASGGGQQGPILAAAGAQVTVLDNSPQQLARDRAVAEREGLEIRTVEGDMADLSAFEDASFDLIVHPVSNVFAPEVRPVWREAYRVLRERGALLAGIAQPALYLFDYEVVDRTGELTVTHSLPYADSESLSSEARKRYEEEGHPLEFSHTLEDQIGGQVDAGFALVGFYEDVDPNADWDPLGKYMSTYFATRSVKLTAVRDLIQRE